MRRLADSGGVLLRALPRGESRRAPNAARGDNGGFFSREESAVAAGSLGMSKLGTTGPHPVLCCEWSARSFDTLFGDGMAVGEIFDPRFLSSD